MDDELKEAAPPESLVEKVEDYIKSLDLTAEQSAETVVIEIRAFFQHLFKHGHIAAPAQAEAGATDTKS